ncbi:DNA-binding transcriptional regulator, GntR family [Actinacidiphila alni]|uniref:DNA-binding transcriptional regulator, GntR family n=1 Tax=Actinacidiphila alni TaxID=380248 RepID=A0A1I2FGR4_9ACTN|nr:GntR family transcriptional regulator [Actinacidiphila alni]SFF03948.1 DNA-binding transcriptional regulator, GntR family [Actinacidiphila alni]
MQQTDTARARLRDLILDGAYAPGERLTETEVALSLAMSRTPVREAFRALVADGLVHSAGRGVRVVALDAEALRHAYQVRAALEALTAELAAVRQAEGRIAPADLAELVRDADRTEVATLAGRLTEAVGHNRRFHRRIAELAANPVALASLDRLWDQILVSTRASLDPPHRPAQVNAQHRELLAAVTEGRARDAAEAARRHVLDTCDARARAR